MPELLPVLFFALMTTVLPSFTYSSINISHKDTILFPFETIKSNLLLDSSALWRRMNLPCLTPEHPTHPSCLILQCLIFVTAIAKFTEGETESYTKDIGNFQPLHPYINTETNTSS